MKFRKLTFPDPLALALALTLLVFLFGFWAHTSSGVGYTEATSSLAMGWYDGLWDTTAGGLYFAFQMILILVLGHVLALSKPVKAAIQTVCSMSKTNTQAVVMIALMSVVLGYLNWGLALVLSALMVKKTVQRFSENGQKLNVGLLGASAYLCMVVWHGGFSGSSPAKSTETEALRTMLQQAGYAAEGIPESIPVQETLFSSLNLFVVFASIILLPLTAWLLNRFSSKKMTLVAVPKASTQVENDAEKSYFLLIFGLLILGLALWMIFKTDNFFNLNYINLVLLGLCFVAHRSISAFSSSVQTAIQDASGILIQFPLYFGIIGIMKASGLTLLISEFIVNHASASNFPLLSFLSAGLLNFFIPSGGGQFYVQGPMLLNAAQELQVSLSKTVMAISYGDQWTNMLQPFWALPLIGITKIKLSALLPYCFAFFVLSGFLFSFALWWF